ncbi:flavodoxin domain-containing protein [Prauserella flavalba]|uniref:flavodoxin domain-containing protein n=1 Tax=Prauserella flavalba TaxID=1477506 RepID=UPI0036DFEB87
MKAVVVFESMFGNTESVARAVAEGLRRHGSVVVDVVNVDDAQRAPGDDVQLVVAGGPTHAFGLSRKRTRESAKQQATGALVTRRTGLREWLDALPGARPSAWAAAFATKAAKPRWLPGSAAKAAAKRLRGKGYRLITRPKDFTVEGTGGPLSEGQLARAREWGAELGATWMSAVDSRS